MMAAESMLVAVAYTFIAAIRGPTPRMLIRRVMFVVRQDVQRCFEMRRLRLKNLSDHDIS